MGSGAAGANTLAWRWDAISGYAFLDDLPGGDVHAITLAGSADGSTIVGASSSERSAASNPFAMEAFQWTRGGGTIPMGDVSGGSFSSNAIDVTADGATAIGAGVGPLYFEAFLWSSQRTMHRLRDVLVYDYGFGPEAWHWQFQIGRCISADGTVLAGDGRNALGEDDSWVIFLDGPWRCGADYNRDGTADSRDFFEFLACVFDPSDRPQCPPDFNHDGSADTADVIFYIDAFLRGCP